MYIVRLESETYFTVYQRYPRVLFLFLFIGACSLVNSQSLDSIVRVIEQEESLADRLPSYKSLTQEYKNTNPELTIELANHALQKYQDMSSEPEYCEILYNLATAYYNQLELDSLLNTSNQVKECAERIENSKLMAAAYNLIGLAHKARANYSAALEAFISSTRVAQESEDQSAEGVALINMAQIYNVMGDTTGTVRSYKEAISIFSTLQDSFNMAISYQNLGIYSSNIDTAIFYQEQALKIFRGLDHQIGMGYSLNGIGSRLFLKGAYAKGLRYLRECQEIWEKAEFEEALPAVYLNLGTLYFRQGIYSRAEPYWDKAVDLALKNEDYAFLSEIYETKTSEYKSIGSFESALSNYENYNEIQDSIDQMNRMEELDEIRARYEDEKKETEIALLNKDIEIRDLSLRRTRSIIIILGIGMALLLGLSAITYRYYQKAKKAQEESDKLLLNILPSEIAAELKAKGQTTAHAYSSIAVLFTDFQGFSTTAAHQDASSLVDLIGLYFKRFDEIIDQYSIEKIKTIGDSYLAVSGLDKSESYLQDLVEAALDMQDFVIELRDRGQIDHAFSMRVGLHIGPVVAGVVGIKKFQYDIWGNTVNIASRMESTGEIDRVAVSAAVYDELSTDPRYAFEERGEIDVKNIGLMSCYFVSRR